MLRCIFIINAGKAAKIKNVIIYKNLNKLHSEMTKHVLFAKSFMLH